MYSNNWYTFLHMFVKAQLVCGASYERLTEFVCWAEASEMFLWNVVVSCHALYLKDFLGKLASGNLASFSQLRVPSVYFQQQPLPMQLFIREDSIKINY